VPVTLCGPIFVYGDTISVVRNTQRPESVLKKKSNSIFYHAENEFYAMGESIIGHVPSAHNPADICTKVVSGGHDCNHLIRLLFYVLYDLICPLLHQIDYVSVQLIHKNDGL
jgi:hypothetical protein